MSNKNGHDYQLSFDHDVIFHDIFPMAHVNDSTGQAMDLPPLPQFMDEDEAWLELYADDNDLSAAEDDFLDDSDDSIQKVVMDALLRSKTDQDKVALRARKRKRAVEELLSTERTYVDLMTKVMNHYITKLNTKKKILSSDDYKIIFPSSFGIILKLNSTFLFDLQSVIQSTQLNQTITTSPTKHMKTLGIVMTTETLGDVLFKFCPSFSLYKAYCSNYSAAATLLATLRKKSNSAFSKYCDKQMAASYFNNLCLEQLIILPIQRMPRYKLLLQEIIKHTEQHHPDLEQLHKALLEINKVNDSINENIKELESRVQVQNIENRFKGKININNLVTPSRRYVGQGRLCKLEADDQIYYLFVLFNDSILYANEGMFGNKLINARLIEFNAKFCVKKTSGPIKLVSNIKNLFQIHSAQESFMLFADTQSSMHKWCTMINKTYELYMSSGTVKPADEAQLYQKTLFLPNNFASKCMVKGCKKKFSLMNKRCHCDICGLIVCSSCRKRKIGHRLRGVVKVCEVCFKNYKESQANELCRMNTLKLTEAAINSMSPMPDEFKEVPNFNPLNSSIAKKRVSLIMRSRMMKQTGDEEILVTGYLRILSYECGLKGALGSNIVYLCNLSYGSTKRKNRMNFRKRYSSIKRKKY